MSTALVPREPQTDDGAVFDAIPVFEDPEPIEDAIREVRTRLALVSMERGSLQARLDELCDEQNARRRAQARNYLDAAFKPIKLFSILTDEELAATERVDDEFKRKAAEFIQRQEVKLKATVKDPARRQLLIYEELAIMWRNHERRLEQERIHAYWEAKRGSTRS
jgi:hypothetical protein